MELNDTQTNAVLDVWNTGTSYLTWSASATDSWITLINTNGTITSERDSDTLRFWIDPSAVPNGVSNGTIRVLGGGQTNSVRVHYE